MDNFKLATEFLLLARKTRYIIYYIRGNKTNFTESIYYTSSKLDAINLVQVLKKLPDTLQVEYTEHKKINNSSYYGILYEAGDNN